MVACFSAAACFVASLRQIRLAALGQWLMIVGAPLTSRSFECPRLQLEGILPFDFVQFGWLSILRLDGLVRWNFSQAPRIICHDRKCHGSDDFQRLRPRESRAEERLQLSFGNLTALA